MVQRGIKQFTQRLAITAVVLSCGVAAALQPATQTVPQPQKPTEAKPAEPPSLDELLGITPEKPDKPADGADAKPATDTTRTELDRALSPKEIREDFERAVALMGETSQRLNDSRDAGLGTQRLQEDILRMLDKLIKDAEQQQQQSRSSSSSSSSSSQQQNQQNQQQQASSQQQQQNRGDGNNTGSGPARQEAQPRTQAAGSSATWGNLPDHLRDALVQGAGDRFSEMYRSLTEEYYKRLAEDPKAEGSPR